jgi:hypothetical protein
MYVQPTGIMMPGKKENANGSVVLVTPFVNSSTGIV